MRLTEDSARLGNQDERIGIRVTCHCAQVLRSPTCGTFPKASQPASEPVDGAGPVDEWVFNRNAPHTPHRGTASPGDQRRRSLAASRPTGRIVDRAMAAPLDPGKLHHRERVFGLARGIGRIGGISRR
jgi:hypothetical protein